MQKLKEKALYIAEKPSVAAEFAKVLKIGAGKRDGFIESEDCVVTWCVGHLVTMSYPESYDEGLKRWSLNTLPFLPEKFKYEIIESVKKQFSIVSGLLNRKDIAIIYVCTDSGREGEYIYRLVEQMSGDAVKHKIRKRVWIDSQTEEEILRGIREAKDLSEYDNLSASAYLRAKEDYLMGINFSRLLTLKYGKTISSYLRLEKNTVISVGRVMTCVLGMIVRREREIREFVKTPFYRVLAYCVINDKTGGETKGFECEWKAKEGSKYYGSPILYKDNGFKEKEDAVKLTGEIDADGIREFTVEKTENKKETKNPPLLYNLAELQNECSKKFKISPDETLQIAQELYEKKLITYPRTDARVLSSAVAKEIYGNINGLKKYSKAGIFSNEIITAGNYKKIASGRYVDDRQITDHYAIIPTGYVPGNLETGGLSNMALKVYELIVRRFLSIFYPAAVYRKLSFELSKNKESFFAGVRVLAEPGYLKVADASKDDTDASDVAEYALYEDLKKIKKGDKIPYDRLYVREGETSPPKRYNSGSIILAMENAGQLIEDEELRSQIKGSGIGTSATRAEILKKLVNNKYISLNKKTQILTPTQTGEMIYDVVYCSIKPLLNPELTASWEKGLKQVADGTITEAIYMDKLQSFVARRVDAVKKINNLYNMKYYYDKIASYYKK